MKELIDFINICILDNEISEKEKNAILKKAEGLNIPKEECEIIMDSLLKKNNASEALATQPTKEYQAAQKVKHNYTPRKPVFKERPLLIKGKELLEDINSHNSEIQKKLSSANICLEKLSKIDDELEQKRTEINTFMSSSKELKKKYLGVLKHIQSNIENELNTKTINSKLEDLLFVADKNNITEHYLKATWSLERLTRQRKLFYAFFLGFGYVLLIYWVLEGMIYLENDNELNSSYVYMDKIKPGWFSEKTFFGLPGYVIFIAACISIYLSDHMKKKAASNSLNFNVDNISNSLNKIITPEIELELNIFNKVNGNLNALKKELTFKTNYQKLKDEKYFNLKF